jgi:hypothetical protein
MPRPYQIGKAHRDKSRFLVGSEGQNIFGAHYFSWLGSVFFSFEDRHSGNFKKVIIQYGFRSSKQAGWKFSLAAKQTNVKGISIE